MSVVYFLYQMLSGTDPDNAAIPYLTAVSSSQKIFDPFFETLKTFKRYLTALNPCKICMKNFRIICLMKTIRSDRTGIISSLPNYRKSFHVKTYPMKSSNSKKYKTTPPPVWRPTWHSIPASRLPRPHRRRRPVRDQPSSCCRPPGSIDR